MMQAANIYIDPASRMAVTAMLSGIKGGYPKAMTRALNAGLSTAKVEGSRKVRKFITAKAKHVNKEFKENKASYSNFSASLIVTGNNLPLIYFSCRQTNKGVSVQIFKSQGRKLREGAFIAKTHSRYKKSAYQPTAVYERVHRNDIVGTGVLKRGKRYKIQLPDEYRFGIFEHYGPSVQSVFKMRNILPEVEKLAAIQLDNELARQVELILATAK